MFEQIQNVRERMRHNVGDLIVACPPMKTNVNVSALVRTASCMGARKVIITGKNKVEERIAKDYDIEVSRHNSLLPVIKKMKAAGRLAIGIEQSVNSKVLGDFIFPKTPILLVVGHERTGISPEILAELDEVVEIPLAGQPHSLNVAVAASMFIHEYMRQMR